LVESVLPALPGFGLGSKVLMGLTFENFILCLEKYIWMHYPSTFFSGGTVFGRKLAQDMTFSCWLTKPLSSVPRMGDKSGGRLWDKSCKSYKIWTTVS